ncbi:MAG: hydrogenase maturation protease [Planctomycetota bacterium]|nr:hydrogenase maturation protease [Planctomycetota bacterium]
MSSEGGHDHPPHAGIDTAEHLAEHLGEIVSPSMAVVCVGNELCGDDAAGTIVARKLTAKTVPWDVYDTQSVPESFLMKIVARKPASVVLVDALDFNAEPGAVELVAANEIGGQGPSTHGPAPLAFLEVLQMMHPCRCAVLGIQPKQVDFGQAVSKPVAAAVELVASAFELLARRKS